MGKEEFKDDLLSSSTYQQDRKDYTEKKFLSLFKVLGELQRNSQIKLKCKHGGELYSIQRDDKTLGADDTLTPSLFHSIPEISVPHSHKIDMPSFLELANKHLNCSRAYTFRS